MKQLMVIIGTALLGCVIFDMMAGNGPDSLKTVSAEAIKKAIYMYG
ncbi:MAG: hypothetical protein IKW01_02725 [Firmicutes bacterium]|nr:hypothetical protein [Bacillota bacterium]